MMIRILLSVLILISLPMTGFTQNNAQPVDLEQQIKVVEYEIKELELWMQMQDAAVYVPKKSRCRTYLEMAEQTRVELKALNAKYAGRANAKYRRQAESLLDSNRRAVEEYRSCFGSVVGSGYDKIAAANVYRYQPFLARYNQLLDKYGEGRVDSRVAELQELLDSLKEELTSEETGQNTSAGSVVKVFREVEILRKDKWIAAKQGMAVNVDDEIRTGRRSRARIVLNDRCEKINAGPTVINIGSDSHTTLSKYKPLIGDDICSGRDSAMDLVRGTLRAFSRGWGSRSAFSVRAGTSLCGIRGTEVVVSYDPSWDEAEFWLDHGDAFMVTKSGKQSLKPGHVVRISSGTIRGERPFSRDEYAGKVAATAESDDLSLEAAMASRPSVTIKPNTSNSDQNRLAAASKARQDVESFLAAYGRHDWDTVLRYLPPAGRKKVQADLNKPGGEAEIVANANLPSKWRIDCLSCETDVKCDIYLILSYTKKPNQYEYTHWSLGPDQAAASENWMVTKSHNPSEKEYKAGIQACSSL